MHILFYIINSYGKNIYIFFKTIYVLKNISNLFLKNILFILLFYSLILILNIFLTSFSNNININKIQGFYLYIR